MYVIYNYNLDFILIRVFLLFVIGIKEIGDVIRDFERKTMDSAC